MIWAALQFALPMTVLYADAFEQLDSAGRHQTHVEASSTASCRPAHPEECALCRFLSTSGGSVETKTTLVVPRIVRPAIAAKRFVLTEHCSGLPSSRAPPMI